ncbi:MAG: rhomboid family intramembrane serine protease [Sphingomonadaceae bacterium]
MIPISESVDVRRRAWVTTTLVAICVAVFLYELLLPSRALDRFIQQWGASSQLILAALAGHPRVPRGELLTLVTSQFLHADWLHLLSNMVFLWVFGRAVEDRFGHLPYLAIYLLGGAGAGIFQSWMTGPESNVVMIGASGAIATVLGTYLVSFPTAWVTVLVPIFVFFWAFDVPAVLMLAFWFLSQFFTGLTSFSQIAAPSHIAIWAHVAGFVLGMGVGVVVPREAGRAGGRRRLERRPDGPGPAGLVSSVGTLIGLALGLRILLILSLVRPGRSLIGQLADVVFGFTDPVVRPFAAFIPRLTFAGLPFDLPALVAMLVVYLVSLLLIETIRGRSRRGEGRRGYR